MESDRNNDDNEVNYFVCTLGQAKRLNEKHSHSYKTVNDFIDTQNLKVPNELAVGIPRQPHWDCHLLCKLWV